MKTKNRLLISSILSLAACIAFAPPAPAQENGSGTATTATTPVVSSINPVVRSNAIDFVQGVSNERNVTVSIAPSYAPNLINNDGKNDQWGACIALTYHPKGAIGQYTFAGIRLDYLGSKFWAPSINGGLKADVQIFGFNVTPLAYTGAAISLSGGGGADGNVGVIVGGGVKADVWQGKLLGMDSKLAIFAAAEKWSQFDGMIYHVGPSLTLSW